MDKELRIMTNMLGTLRKLNLCKPLPRTLPEIFKFKRELEQFIERNKYGN
jgi:hypothetical protein